MERPAVSGPARQRDGSKRKSVLQNLNAR
jgi:hypothetical protein